MTRRLRSLNGGRARIWWLLHGREAIRAIQLVAIVALFLAASHFDYTDAIEAEKAAHRDVAEQLRQERIARKLERITFVIEASTPAEAQAKLAIIAGDADTQRYRLWVAK